MNVCSICQIPRIDCPHGKSTVAALVRFDERVRAGKVEQPRLGRGGSSRGTPEHDEQRALVKWLRLGGYPVIAPINGSRLSGSDHDRARQWGKLVSLGASSGVPDVFTMRADLETRGSVNVVVAAIEMKAPDARAPSPEQQDWHQRLRAIGCKVIVAYGWEEARRELQAIGFGRAA